MTKTQISALLFLSTAISLVFIKDIPLPVAHSSLSTAGIAGQEDLITSLTVSFIIIAVYALYWLKQKI